MLKVTINEKGGGERVLEFVKDRISIGRSQRNDIILPRSNVSKKHATVEVRGGSCVVTDLDSTNGTFVNGRRIKGPAQVVTGDKLFISDFIMVIDISRPGASQVPVPPPLPGASAAATLPKAGGSPSGAGARSSDGSAEAALEPDEIEPVEEAEPVSGDDEPEPETGLRRDRASQPEPMQEEKPRDLSRDSIRGDSSSRLRAALLRSQDSDAGGARRSVPPVAVQAPRPSTPPPRPAEPPQAQPARQAAPQRPARPAAETRKAPAEDRKPTPAVRPLGEGGLQSELFRQVDAILDLDRLEPPIFGDEEFRRKTSRTVAEVLDSLVDAGKLPHDIEPSLMAERITREILGLGQVEALLQDPDVREIVIPPGGDVTVIGAGGSRSIGNPFVSDKSRRLVLKKLLARIKDREVEGTPAVTGTLAGGEEVRMLLPPVVLEGLAAVIRKPSTAHDGGLDALVEAGVLSTGMSRFLGYCIEGRQSLLLCDADLSSHRTLVPAISSQLAGWERLVALQCGLEPLYDLSPRIYARLPPDGGLDLESPGGDLAKVIQAFTPTALVMGEIREASHLAMVRRSRESRAFTLSTMAASSDVGALAIALKLLAVEHPGLAPSLVSDMLVETFDIVMIHARMMDGSQKVTRISELLEDKDGMPELKPIFRWELAGLSEDGAMEGSFRATRHVPAFVDSRRGKTKGLRFDTTVFQ